MMSIRERSIRTEGIVLRRKDFGESDRLLVLFTRKLGRVSVIAKGARKPSSKISGHLELFMRSSFLISRGRNLHILTQADAIEDFEPLRKNLTGFGLGSYVVELIDAVTYEEGSNEKLYNLLISTLDSLSAGENTDIIIRYYEIHLLDLVGFRPELFVCVECNKKIIERDQFISGHLGGTVCPECALGNTVRGLKPVSARVLKYFRHFQRSDRNSLIALDIPGEIMDELEKLIQYYLTHTLESHLNSPVFNKRIKDGL
ncbi:MAG: DNA repair protein RecO [Anaerolineales bacterium]|nr:DNA repair protein RecO [Anaerolineales bacterium]